jgi:hypothetical protein
VGLGEACSVSFFPGQRRVTLLVGYVSVIHE